MGDEEKRSVRTQQVARLAQTEAPKPQEAPPQTRPSKLAQITPKAVEKMKGEVQSTVGQQQKAAERVVGMTAQLFADAVKKDATLTNAVRNSQLNTLLGMVG